MQKDKQINALSAIFKDVGRLGRAFISELNINMLKNISYNIEIRYFLVANKARASVLYFGDLQITKRFEDSEYNINVNNVLCIYI